MSKAFEQRIIELRGPLGEGGLYHGTTNLPGRTMTFSRLTTARQRQARDITESETMSKSYHSSNNREPNFNHQSPLYTNSILNVIKILVEISSTPKLV